MPPTDLIPCFYTGQNADVSRPAKVETRARCREMKKAKVGEFKSNGKIFVFKQRIETAIIFGGPPSAKNILAFLKTRTDGTPLHYEIPMAGDGSLFARHRPRSIDVSKRLPNEVAIAQMSADFNWRKRLKNVQVIPA